MRNTKIIEKFIFSILILIIILVNQVDADTPPYFCQRDEPWASYTMNPGGCLFENYGCATTCCAMLLYYYGKMTDPGHLNNWLNSHSGYADPCMIYWAKPAEYSGGLMTGGTRINYGTTAHNILSETEINDYLDDNKPVLVEVYVGGAWPWHWVLVYNKDGSTYYIHDPYWNERTTMSSYDNNIYGYVLYDGIPSPTREWDFDYCTEGWIVDGGSTQWHTEYFDGELMMDPGSTDPRIWSPSGLYVDPTPGHYQYVIIRMASNCDSLRVQLFYTTTDSPAFSEGKSKSLDLTMSGPWYELCFDFRDKLSWTNGGRITQLRLDPAPSGDSGSDNVGIDYVRLSTTPLSIDENIIHSFAFTKAYPNPFNSSCHISAPEGAIIEIFDLNGKCVSAFDKTPMIWKPDEKITSGVYLIRATLGEQTIVKRAILMK